MVQGTYTEASKWTPLIFTLHTPPLYSGLYTPKPRDFLNWGIFVAGWEKYTVCFNYVLLSVLFQCLQFSGLNYS